MDNEQQLNLVIKKCLFRLLPFLILMYVIAFIDRANVGFAKTVLQADAGLSDVAFAFGAGIFFLGYAVFEFPSNLAMHHFGARIWLSRIMITWGLVSAAMAFTNNATTFYILRFLLGIAEAGFFPGVILYLTYWFPEKVRSQAIGIFYFGLPLALIFGGPLSGWLLEMNPPFNFKSWQWMFIIEGLMASVVGIITLFYIKDNPEKANWLNDSEKNILKTVLQQEENNKKQNFKTSPHNLKSLFLNPSLIFFCFIYLAIQMSVYGVVFYLPTRLAEISNDKVGLTVGFLTAIPWVFALFWTFFITKIADKTKKHRIFACLMLVCAGIGIAFSTLTNNLILVIIAFCFATSGFVSVQPLYWTLPTTYLTGGIVVAGGIALINSVGNIGGFIAPNLKTWAENQFNSSQAGMFCLSFIAFIGAIMLLLMKNKKSN